MIVPRKVMWVAYAAVGVLALIGTWANVLGLFREHGFVEGTVQFWERTLVNESSRLITVDLLFLALSAIVWMFLEARRLGIRGIWLYVAFGILIGISAAFPFFMAHRERRLATLEPGQAAGRIRPTDILLIAALAFGVFAYVVRALSL